MSDHASKSRFIIPGLKGFSSEDASWISAGATSFVHVPYRLRISHRRLPLSGSLVGGLVDRALAGFKCLLEQGVEPLARLIWAAQLRQQPGRSPQRAPLPVITADPPPVQERQQRDLAIRRGPKPAETSRHPKLRSPWRSHWLRLRTAAQRPLPNRRRGLPLSRDRTATEPSNGASSVPDASSNRQPPQPSAAVAPSAAAAPASAQLGTSAQPAAASAPEPADRPSLAVAAPPPSAQPTPLP